MTSGVDVPPRQNGAIPRGGDPGHEGLKQAGGDGQDTNSAGGSDSPDRGGNSKGSDKARVMDELARKKQARKRTKTGCQTCRRRRIKCDEFHPICRNCTKSKRMCEGYSHQRVVFKAPYHPDQYRPIVYQANGTPVHGFGAPGMGMGFMRHPQSSLPHIAPKPSLGLDGQIPTNFGPLFIPHDGANQTSISPLSPNGFGLMPRPPGQDGLPPGAEPYVFMQHPQDTPPSASYQTMPRYESSSRHRTPSSVQSPTWPTRTDNFGSGIQGSPARANGPFPGFSEGVIATPAIMEQIYPHLRDQPYLLQISEPQSASPPQSQPQPQPQPQQQQLHQQQAYSQPRIDADGEEEEEDIELVTGEYSDMSDEDDGDDDHDNHDQETPQYGMMADIISAHQIVPHHRYDVHSQDAYDFAQIMTLASSIPTNSGNPFTDPIIRTIFIHFVNATGPIISLYERCAFDAPRLAPGPASRGRVASVWTYTFPALALNHQALMQAILAIGSLQIATRQKVPPTAAMKHYSRAIRRIARNVRSLTRRTRPATLAATLLLAYFEVWSSDHSKWCNHLFGARILFREIDLRGMTRVMLPLKRLQRACRGRQQHRPQTSSLFGTYEAECAFGGPDEPDDLALDTDVINEMAGSFLTMDDYGLGENSGVEMDPSSAQADRAIAEYEQLRDLFWWYAKMDVYQSMLGGTKLFMEFEHWTQCPPRGPIGNVDLVYGSYDHLMLLLGRLTSFASRDLARKTRAFKSHQQPGGPGPASPMFAGIMPPQHKVSAPMGFSPQRDTSPYSEQSEEIMDAEAALAVAMREWNAILEAFDTFKARLGPMFEPLAPEYTDRRMSPFGPSLQYRTFSMAGIWMNYYMGMIHLHRTHPSMPPVAMMAAGQAAQVTAPYAMAIGQIASGLGEYKEVLTVSTLVAAALIESCFCLFVAAITYRDMAQRRWMVHRMHDVARLTGWQSARQIADGCESGWLKAYQMGRGPPYERLEVRDEPSSIWANPRRIDRIIRNTPENRLALVRSERTHYALGLLSVEMDFEKLELKEEPM